MHKYKFNKEIPNKVLYYFRDLSILKLSPLLASLIASCRDNIRKSFVLSISMIRDDFIIYKVMK